MPVPVRLVFILLTILAVILWIWLAVKYRRQWLYAVPPLVWLTNLLLFELATLAHALYIYRFDVVLLNVWSAAISILAVVLVFGIGLVWLIGGTPYYDLN